VDNRDVWVDYAKAIGIILVVYGHVARGLHSAGMSIPIELYELADSIVYSFHMPLFFFLSGLFFYNSLQKRDGISLINSKLDTIIYPYIIWSIMQGLIEVFLSDYTNGNVAYSEVFSLLWSPRAQFWFLYVLFICFCIAIIIFSIKSKKMAIFAFLLSVLIYIYPSVLPNSQVFQLIAYNFVYFTFGIIFSLYFSADRLSKAFFVYLSVFGFILSQFVFHFILGLNFTDKGIESLLLAVISILFIVSLSSRLALKPNKLFIFIGTSSMAIYLMHILTGSGVRVVLEAFMGVDSFVYHLIVGVVVGVFLPLLALIIIKKLRIKYLFSAPVSHVIAFLYNKAFQRIR